MKEYKYKIAKDELWYLGVCAEGINMPISADDEYEFNLSFDYSANQTTTALISTKGRYIYSHNGFMLRVRNGEIAISSDFPVVLEEGFCDLKGAYLHLSKSFYPSSGKIPPVEFFKKPQFNTWIEFNYYVTQEKVLRYAEDIQKNGIDCGVFIVDCGWSTYNGSFKFKTEFPSPKKMVQELHDKGFKVMLWVCPFITSDTIEFRYLRDNGMLVNNADGSVAIREWWDGYSAILDMTNPKTKNWLIERLDYLVNEYGFDGFKFDAGDHWYYRDDDVVFSAKDAIESSQAWVKLGLKYAFNEYRASSNMGGMALVQRLKDKKHTFGEYGLASLIPSTLMQNLFGYYYTCPDMIGGGDYAALKDESDISQELIVRYCQCSALMPMMQFSLSPWRILSKQNFQRVKDAVEIHKGLVPYYLELMGKMAEETEPIVRLMEYNYPNCGFASVVDQFMIGDKYVCAPIVEEGATERIVILPKGSWLYGGRVYSEGKNIIEVTLDTLPIFEKIC